MRRFLSWYAVKMTRVRHAIDIGWAGDIALVDDIALAGG
jgi:hypothetical protein